jgi:hypothetical protein
MNTESDFQSGTDTRAAVKELMNLPPSRELELPPTAGKPARQLMRKLGLETADSPRMEWAPHSA